MWVAWLYLYTVACDSDMFWWVEFPGIHARAIIGRISPGSLADQVAFPERPGSALLRAGPINAASRFSLGIASQEHTIKPMFFNFDLFERSPGDSVSCVLLVKRFFADSNILGHRVGFDLGEEDESCRSCAAVAALGAGESEPGLAGIGVPGWVWLVEPFLFRVRLWIR